MTSEQLIIEIRKMRLQVHNCGQAYKGAVHRKRQLAGKVKALKDQVRQQEENLKKLEEQLPELKHKWEQAEQLLQRTESKQRGPVRILENHQKSETA